MKRKKGGPFIDSIDSASTRLAPDICIEMCMYMCIINIRKMGNGRREMMINDMRYETGR